VVIIISRSCEVTKDLLSKVWTVNPICILGLNIIVKTVFRTANVTVIRLKNVLPRDYDRLKVVGKMNCVGNYDVSSYQLLTVRIDWEPFGEIQLCSNASSFGEASGMYRFIKQK